MTTSKKDRADRWLLLAESFAKYPSVPDRLVLVVLFLVPVLAVPIGILLLFSDADVGASAKDADVIRGAGFFFLGLGLLAVPIAFLQRRVQQRGRELRHSFRSAVEKRGGRVLDGRQLAQWLIHYWDGDYPQASLMSTSKNFRAALQLEGVFVLVDVTPVSFKIGGGEFASYGWWARVVVAAGHPLLDFGLNPEDPGVLRIQSRGYEPQWESGCLIARGSAGLEKVFKRKPATVLDVFDVAADLVQLTKAQAAAQSRR